jgi:hypothetical protein
MTPPGNQFYSFLRVVQRRMVFMRILERIGVALFLASAAALLLLALLYWYARPTSPAVVASLLAGLIGGLIWGLIRPPTLLQAALIADDQLNTADLLSTACLCRRNHPDAPNPWLQQIFAEADRRCRALSPRSITVHRLSGRVWGAVVLAVSLVVIVNGLAPLSAKQQADAPANRPGDLALEPGRRADRSAPEMFVSADNRPILLGDPEDADASRFGQNAAVRPPAANTNPASSDNPDLSSHTDISANEPGPGHGSARTHPPGSPDKPPAPVANAGPGSPSTEPGAKPAAGAGSANGNTTPGEAASSAHAAASGSSSPVPPPPWTSDQWPADVRRAQSAVTAGQIPSQYRDLVRGYFSDVQ